MVGQTFSHYHVLGKLGEGGTAVVYKAEDLALGRAVALKFLPREVSTSNAGSVRFEHEARTASSLNHPNICTIYEIGEHDGCRFLAMELLDGRTLTHTLAAGSLEVGRLLELGIQIADGLDAAHAAQVVHRDIKPANIFVTSREHVKILDFGVAVLVPRSSSNYVPAALPRSAGVAGTVPYMSPEQLRGEELDARSDLFSLGVVLYEMAAGRRPFPEPTTPATPARDVRPDLPLELDRIIGKALEPDRKFRFQSASDLRADLQRLKRDLDAKTTTMSVLPVIARVDPSDSPARAATAAGNARRRFTAAVGAGALLGVLALGALASVRLTSPPLPAAPSLRLAALASPVVSAKALHEGNASLPAAQPPVAPPDGQRKSTEQDLKLARSEVALHLYDQALVTLRGLVAAPGDSVATTDAYFLIGSIQETQGKIEDAMATYLEIAHRYRGKPRGAEAQLRLGQVTLQSKRRGKESDAMQAFAEVAKQYPKTEWAARALMAKAELEEQRQTAQYDSVARTSVPSALVTYRRVATDYARYPESQTALWKLGQLYERVKRYDLAARTFRDLAVRFPKTQYEAWFRAAELYDRRVKNSKAARAAYAHVPRTSSHFDEAQKRLHESGTGGPVGTNARLIKPGG